MAFEVRSREVLALGWIPYARDHRMFPAYARWLASEQPAKRPLLRTALNMLFRSGNMHPPDQVFRALPDFEKHVRRNEFRAALVISNIRLRCSDDGIVERIDASLIDEDLALGCTPMNLLVKTHYGKGNGVVKPMKDWDAEKGWVGAEVLFRLGKLPNLGSFAMTQHWAPFARMSVKVEVWPNLDMKIHVNGSYIPTQYTSSDGHRHEHHMIDNTPEQISSFMYANESWSPNTEVPAPLRVEASPLQLGAYRINL